MTFTTYGQNWKKHDAAINTSKSILLNTVKDSAAAASYAIEDIESGKIILLIQSGYAPVIYSDDKKFERKFKCYLSELGCVGPSLEILEAYNFRMFDELFKKYGINWVDKIRPDIIGLEKWKIKTHHNKK